MAKYLVRCDITYSAIVEAASEDEAIQKAPLVPAGDEEWDTSDADYEAEELDG